MTETPVKTELLQRAQWYRARAVELHAIADGLKDVSSRTALEGAARSYEEMAELCERRGAAVPEA